jgi:hypothetical protein
MDKSKYSNQVIQEHHGDHVGQDERYDTMTTSAGPREIWQLSWSDVTLSEQPPSLFRPHLGCLPTSQNRRAHMARRWRQRNPFGALGHLLVLVGSLWVIPATAVFIDFQNCLSESYQNDQPLQLQFDPLYMDAVFNTTDPTHNLHITVWGNVTGSGPEKLVYLPPANDTAYWNSNQTNLGGKIQDNPDPQGANKLTALFTKVNVLTYEPWSQNVDFCNQLINATCPLGPSFTANA